MYLGRVWGPYSTVVYAYTYMADIIFPGGWDNWNDPVRENTVHYGQYRCSGVGAKEIKRVPWSRELSSKEVVSFFNWWRGVDHINDISYQFDSKKWLHYHPGPE
jgi:pectinesterase